MAARKTKSPSGNRSNTRSNTRKRTAGNSRKAAGAKIGSRNKKEQTEEGFGGLGDEAVLLIALGVSVLLFLCNFGITGVVGKAVSGFIFGLMGILSYVFPFLLFFGVAFRIANKKSNVFPVRKFAALAALFIAAGIIADLASGASASLESYSAVKLYEFSSGQRKGGGFIFGSIAYLLKKLIGSAGAYVVLAILIIMAIVMLTDKSFVSIVSGFFGRIFGREKAYGDDEPDRPGLFAKIRDRLRSRREALEYEDDIASDKPSARERRAAVEAERRKRDEDLLAREEARRARDEQMEEERRKREEEQRLRDERREKERQERDERKKMNMLLKVAEQADRDEAVRRRSEEAALRMEEADYYREIEEQNSILKGGNQISAEPYRPDEKPGLFAKTKLFGSKRDTNTIYGSKVIDLDDEDPLNPSTGEEIKELIVPKSSAASRPSRAGSAGPLTSSDKVRQEEPPMSPEKIREAAKDWVPFSQKEPLKPGESTFDPRADEPDDPDFGSMNRGSSIGRSNESLRELLESEVRDPESDDLPGESTSYRDKYKLEPATDILTRKEAQRESRYLREQAKDTPGGAEDHFGDRASGYKEDDEDPSIDIADNVSGSDFRNDSDEPLGSTDDSVIANKSFSLGRSFSELDYAGRDAESDIDEKSNIDEESDIYEDSNEQNSSDFYDEYEEPYRPKESYSSVDGNISEPYIRETSDANIPQRTSSFYDNVKVVTYSSSKEDVDESAKSSTRISGLNKSYQIPGTTMLSPWHEEISSDTDESLWDTAMELQEVLATFKVKAKVDNICQGPAVTRFELKPEVGVKVRKIVDLQDDLKMALAAESIRIEAPIPGKSAVGIEVPNREVKAVHLRELLENPEFTQKYSSGELAFAVGKDISGNVIVADIAKMPHLLIAGSTGSGKSVCINTLIMSILYKSNPDQVKMILIDPKVVELSVYNGIPHLMVPVVTDPKQAASALKWGVAEMTQRYKKFSDLGVRNLDGYNKRVGKSEFDSKDGTLVHKFLPKVVIVVDEMADLMMVAAKEVEESICRLAQLARAAGIHLVLATQRPSVDVITGLIKANMPSRIAFAVSSSIDSRTILDMVGAEKLLGKGDMLFAPQGSSKPSRVQGAFVSDEEVEQVAEFWRAQVDPNEERPSDISGMIESLSDGDKESIGGGGEDIDDLFEKAGRIVIERDKASSGLLMRALKIGFNRAARIIDQLYDAGVVGPDEGTKPRKVLMTLEEFEEIL